MNKWDELRNVIQELHDYNQDKQDVVTIMNYLLNLMRILDVKEKKQGEKYGNGT